MVLEIALLPGFFCYLASDLQSSTAWRILLGPAVHFYYVYIASVAQFLRGYTDDLSVIAMDMHGNIGASTTIQNFSFVTPDKEGKLTVYVARHNEPETVYAPATQQWLDDYMAVRHAGKLEQW